MSIFDGLSDMNSQGFNVTHVVMPSNLVKLQKVCNFFKDYIKVQRNLEHEMSLWFEDYESIADEEYRVDNISFSQDSEDVTITVRLPGEFAANNTMGTGDIISAFKEILPYVSGMSFHVEDEGEYLVMKTIVKGVWVSLDRIRDNMEGGDRYLKENME